MRKMEQALGKLHSNVLEHKLFPAGSKLLLCCSGGADSTAMLHLFSRLRSIMQITLLAVHVDHQLRGAESDADAELVKEQCLQLSMPRGHALRAMALYSQRVFGAQSGQLKSYVAQVPQTASIR